MSTETRKIQFDFIARDRGVGRQMKETGDAAEDMNQGLEGGAGKAGKLGAVMGKLGPIMAGVTAAAALIGPAIMKGLDAQDANAKFKAQLGLTASESKRIGGVAGSLYSSAYGESMDEVRGAITSVIRNMDGMAKASSGDLKQTTARAMDLAQVMDEDVSRVTVGVSQIMRTGLAKNSKEAFDIMTRGAQLGANKGEDLIDTFEEYGVQLKNMGLTGKQSMGLIVQGLQAGGRNADLVADTIKEFSIEAVAGGERVSKGFKSLGLNAGDMSKAFAKGGPGAAKALDTVLDKLRAIKDPVKRNQVAIELFGTKAEDMGKALFALDPSKATAKLGKFAGATDAAGKAMGGTLKSKLTSFKRTIETQVTNVASRALDKLSKFGAEIRKGFKLPATGKATNDWQRMGQALAKVGDWIRTKLVPALKNLAEWFQKKIMPVVVKFHREVLKELVHQVQRVSKELDKSGIPWAKIGSAIKKVYEVYYKFLGPVITWFYKIVLKTLGTWIVLSIKSYGLLWKAIQHVWGSFKLGGKIVAEWYGKAKPALNGFRTITIQVISTVTRLFLAWATTTVKAAAKAFGWIPGLGGKLKRAASEMDAFAKKTNASINKITKSRTVKIKVQAGGSWKEAGGSWSPGSGSYATGGQVFGTVPGATRAYDSQPAMLRVGEHVWTPEEVDEVGGHSAMYRLRGMAKRGLLKGYATGGAVGRGVNVDVSTPNMTPIWRKIDVGMWGMVKKIADQLAKMGGSTAVVRAARSQIGRPYSWGGGGRGGPSYGIGRGAGTYGFDCSGLTEYAWWKGARVGIGGVTDPQWANSRPISGPRPGALAFPSGPSVHVMLGSDRPGYVIQAPYTGSFVQEVRRSSSNWRWPKGAKGYALGGAVERLGEQAINFGGRNTTSMAKLAGIALDPSKRRAMGGSVLGGQAYVVGERGPELMVPGGSGTVHPSGSIIIENLNVHIRGSALASKREIADEVLSALRTVKKQGVVVTV